MFCMNHSLSITMLGNWTLKVAFINYANSFIHTNDDRDGEWKPIVELDESKLLT